MSNTQKKQQKEILDTCALLFMLTCFVAVLTWIIPAGQYEFEVLNGRNVVIPGTYHTVERVGQGPWDVLLATVKGFQNNNALIFLVLFAGAALHMLQVTQSIDKAFNKFVTAKNVKDDVIVLFIMLFLTFGGATGVLVNSAVALLPLGALLSTRMGLDRAAGVFMIYLGCFSGFNVGWATTTLQIAQPIAELPVFSGMSVRVVNHVLNFLLIYFFLRHYIKGIRKDPTRSLNYAPGMQPSEYMGTLGDGTVVEQVEGEMTSKDVVNLIVGFGGIMLIVFGAIQFKWAITEFCGVFLLQSIFLGLYNGYGLNGTCKLFYEGSAKMIPSAFVIGFATALGVVLEAGNILHTIVYYMSIPISKVGPVVGASVMYLANLVINTFIPSGSGQAAAVMPIMVPIADLAGITRQVCIQAFQFGEGFANDIVPTAPVVMAMLGIAGVSYKKWMKFYMPVLLVQAVYSIIVLTILQSIGWTGL